MLSWTWIKFYNLGARPWFHDWKIVRSNVEAPNKSYRFEKSLWGLFLKQINVSYINHRISRSLDNVSNCSSVLKFVVSELNPYNSISRHSSVEGSGKTCGCAIGIASANPWNQTLDVLRICFHNMTLTSHKPCQHNNKCDCSKTIY